MAADESSPAVPATETADPRTTDLDLLPLRAQIAAVLAGDAAVVPAVGAATPAIEAAVLGTVERLERGGRLFYVGAGSAGRIAALDAAEVAPTFGVEPDLVRAVVAGGLSSLTDLVEGLEDDPAAGASDVRGAGLTTRDAALFVSASGTTPYTVAAARYAAGVGAYTVALVANEESVLAVACDHAIVVPTGPEAIAGSTRLRAGTAQKIVLNTISTLVMVGLGKTYGNRMLAVRPDNDKLRARARRVLAEIAGVSEAQADAALAGTGDAPTALVVLLTGADPEQARVALQRTNGRVREAVRDLS